VNTNTVGTIGQTGNNIFPPRAGASHSSALVKIHFQHPIIIYDVMQSTMAGPFWKFALRLYLVNVNRYILFAHLKITGGT